MRANPPASSLSPDPTRRSVTALVASAIGAPAITLAGNAASNELTEAAVTIRDTILRAALPPTYFGFNVNFLNFQNEHTKEGRVDADVVRYLSAFPRAVYRYPGGTIANTFDWEGATGAVAQRRPQLNIERFAAAPVGFGPQEYLDFLREVQGQSWYVLNLLGWSAQTRFTELDSREVAASNGRLAAWRLGADRSSPVRYYQLGNELDRGSYEWAPEKYLQRCGDTIRSVRQGDPDARFVAFLRDFDWRYRSRPGRSTALDFARTVMNGLPMVTDYSMNVYYDESRGWRSDIPGRLQWMRRVVDDINAGRAGLPPAALWITEHARQLPQDKWAGNADTTSGIDGALSSADFIVALTGWSEVQGLFWHALGGGKWSAFVDGEDRVQPTAMYWVLRLLRENAKGRVLATDVASSNRSQYSGGYDVRCTAFEEPEAGRLTVWAVNRSGSNCELTLTRPRYSGRRAEVSLASVAGEKPGDPRSVARVQLDPPRRRISFDESGSWQGKLPARSVCALRLQFLA